MSGKTNIVKGRVKEAAGALTDNDTLRARGKADQAVGKVQAAARTVVKRVKAVVRKATASSRSKRR